MKRFILLKYSFYVPILIIALFLCSFQVVEEGIMIQGIFTYTASLLFILFFIFSSNLPAQQQFYFYTGKDYGSESLFNPISLIVNGGYDVTQLQSVTNRIDDPDFGRKAKVVFHNLSSPLKSISEYGWSKFLKGEFLPLSFEKGNMQWIPNYQQHLIGGGMLYTAMREWYTLHGYPAPWLLSSITVMGQHLMNEILESGPHEGWSVDEVSDIYIFDLGGIVLFSFDNVNRFFSKTLNLSDWSLQSTVTFPHGRVNAGQYFSLKWKFPFSEDYSLFYRYGMGALFGVSKKIASTEGTDNLSVGVGFKTKHLVDVNAEVRQRTIETGWHAGIFYDRNNSLLASIVMSGVKEYFCMIDIYPGVLKYDKFSPGLWTVIGRNGNVMFGLTTRYVFSVGYEVGN